MARRKMTYPGSIYVPANCNRIYIEFKDEKTGTYRRKATGLKNTPEGYTVAQEMLKQIFFRNAFDQKLMGTVYETSSSTPTCRNAFEMFITLHRKKCTERTIGAYSDAYRKILTEEYQETTLSNARIDAAVQEFISGSLTLSPASKNIYLDKFQMFVNYCAKQAWIHPTNYAALYRQAAPAKQIQTFSIEEVHLLQSYFRRTDRLEMALLIEFLFATGFRIGQALDLRWSDIDERRVYRLSKDKERNDPFPLTSELKSIFAQMPRHAKKPDKVFFWGQSSLGALSRQLEAAMEALNIPKNGRSFHVFRKSAATRWAEAGLPIHEVQKLLGHRDSKTTNNYYVSVEVDNLSQKLEKIEKSTPKKFEENLRDKNEQEKNLALV
jgi:integrase